ncbi:MAG: hypothetical protein KBT12_09135 [Bacteroidales bacterium]|nr:hypothetical protein [Candidatus Physcousia equi]
MTNQEYIHQHREDDVRRLALKRVPDGIDLAWCLQQIEGWQLARRKLPRWAATDDVWFPPRLSMEQCSSEHTACYKQQLCQRLVGDAIRPTFADLTGGFGIDFSYQASVFQHATYVERSEALCEIARHNLPLLGLPEAEVVCQTAEQWLDTCCVSQPCSLLFLDPARRDHVGRKVVALEDCTPNVVALQQQLLSAARYVVVKLSPMLDIRQALRLLQGVVEVHVVSVMGECKEVLLVMSSQACSHHIGLQRIFCVNLGTSDASFSCSEEEWMQKAPLESGTLIGRSICEPNASLLKAGVQDILACQQGWTKLHPNSNLFVMSEGMHERQTSALQDESLNPEPHVFTEPQVLCAGSLASSLPPCAGTFGRTFRVEVVCDFSKQGLRKVAEWVAGIEASAAPSPQKHKAKGAPLRANLAVRNFPGAVDDLRKRIRLHEGGDAYIFATTLSDERHVLLCCRK